MKGSYLTPIVMLGVWSIAAPPRAEAQAVTQLKTMSASGDINANGEAVIMPGTAGMASLLIQTTGTFSLTWELQCAGDGTTYDADDEIPVTLISSSPAPADTVTGSVQGLYTATISGCRSIRVIATAFTSGPMTVTLTAIPTGGGSAGGGGGGGVVSGAVSITQGGNTAIVNGAGALSTVCSNCSGSGVSALEDAASANADPGTPAYTVRSDTLGSTTTTNGDYQPAKSTAVGAQWVTLASSAGTELTPSVDVTEDAAETAGGTGPMVLSVRRDVAASSASTTGDNATFNTDGTGLLWTRTVDPCTSGAKTFFPINISTATTTEITPSLAGASTNYYVCSLVLVTNAANNVAIADDDTDNCVSVTSGMAGGTTAATGFVLAANGGLTLGNGAGAVMKTGGANRVICIVTSAATQLSGTMSVVAAP